ncbi:MAG: tRNA pseudouridine(55) synthase TruB [Acidimicrobiales bacterium]
MTGFLVVDKEAGWTSHDVVARCRGILQERRIGHAGTLDPGATGILVLGVGRATRLLRYVSGAAKDYRAEVVLGTTTSTLDDDGEVTGTFDMARVSLEAVRRAASSLTGEIDQRVPMVSAVKVGGERLHRLARAGKEVERPLRRITVERFEVEAGREPGTFSIDVRCSAGTYVRVLAADLGAALGGGAHLRRLRRTRSGSFSESDAASLSSLEAAFASGDASMMRAPLDALDMEKMVVDTDAALDVGHGRPLVDTGAAPGPLAVLDAAGVLLAVYEVGTDGRAKAAVVLEPA